MKLLALAILFFIAVAAIFSVTAYSMLRFFAAGSVIVDQKTGTAPAGTHLGTPNSSPTSTKKFVPQGFVGPTGQPHVIGPSGPPPNY